MGANFENFPIGASRVGKHDFSHIFLRSREPGYKFGVFFNWKNRSRVTNLDLLFLLLLLFIS